MTGESLNSRFFEMSQSVGSASASADSTAGWNYLLNQTSSQPPIESMLISEAEIAALPDSGIDSDGKVYLKIIRPGWGNKYYSEKILRESESRYRSGTKMFWNHASRSEMKDRPERSIRDLAAVFTEAAHYDPAGPKGPGLYVWAQVFKPYREALKELWQYIGVSHNGYGKARLGEAEGRRGVIAESIDMIESVDFVTTPGAGGEIVKMFESRQGLNDLPDAEEKMVPTLESLRTEAPDVFVKMRESVLSGLTVQDIPPTLISAMREALKKELDESAEAQKKHQLFEATVAENKDLKTQIARMQESQAISEAKVVLADKLKNSGLIEASQKRIADSLISQVTLVEGKLEADKFTQLVESTIKSEKEYLETILSESKQINKSTPPVHGFGPSSTQQMSESSGNQPSFNAVKCYMDMGMTEDQAKHAAGVI